MTAAPAPPSPAYSAAELAELLDCRDLTGAPAPHVVLQWAAEGDIPPPDFRRPGGEAYWYRKTIADFVARLSGATPAPVPVCEFYTTRELAALIGMSLRYIEKHRHRIVGARREGRLWRFDRRIVENRLAVGKSIII